MQMLFFLDHNIAGAAAGKLGGVNNAADWADVFPMGNADIQMVKEFATGRAGRLASSTTCLETMRRMLVAPHGDDFDAIDPDDTRATVVAFAAVIRSTAGVIVDQAAVTEALPRVRNVVPRELQGHLKGQVDFEDLTVLATALAAREQAETAEDDDFCVVIVTNDRGLLNCAASMSRYNITIISGAQYARMAA